MIEHITAVLARSQSERPAFTLLLGAGFSHPVIPTIREMLPDIVWWLFCRSKNDDGYRSDSSHVNIPDFAAFSSAFWIAIHSKAPQLILGADGSPEPSAENLALAYRAIMSSSSTSGLSTPSLRREYLRDAITKAGPKINPAHLLLASILREQEDWKWRAPLCRTVFTTNFDPLLQQGLQLVNKLYYMSDRPDVIEPVEDHAGDAVHIIYAHGSIHRYLLLNTSPEIEWGRRKNAPSLVRYFQTHGVIVIGYGGWSDAVMDALKAANGFDGNLYWCDIHNESDAATNLREDVTALLSEREGNAFYVPICKGANEVMLRLHERLLDSTVPRTLASPIDNLLRQVRSIKISQSPGQDSAPDELAEQLLRVGQYLEGMEHIDGEVSPGAIRISILLNNARRAFLEKNLPYAASLLTAVIKSGRASNLELAEALLDSGRIHLQTDAFDCAVRDFTELIDKSDVPDKFRIEAITNRGKAYGGLGRTDEERHDYDAALEISSADVALRAEVLLSRGRLLYRLQYKNEAISDYVSVAELPGAPDEQKAIALGTLAWWYYDRDGNVEALITYSEQAIRMHSNLNWAQFGLGLGLLMKPDTGAAFDQYHVAITKCTTIKELEKAATDIEHATRARGFIEGASQIQSKIQDRIRALRKEQPSS